MADKSGAVKTQTLEKRSLIFSPNDLIIVLQTTLFIQIWRVIMFWTSFGNLHSFKQTWIPESMSVSMGYPSSSQKSKKIMLWCLNIRTFSSSHHMLKILWLLWYYINHIIHLWTWNLIFSYLIQCSDQD